jgi:hypothetical protein
MIFLRSLFILIGVSSVLACSNINQNSLLTNEATKAAGSAVNKVANSTDLSLSVNSPAEGFQVGVNVNDQIELNGDCFASTYPINQIIAVLGTTRLTLINVHNGNDQDHYCVQGRFDIILQGSQLTAVNGNNNIKVSLVGYSSSRQAALVPVGASRMINIIK